MVKRWIQRTHMKKGALRGQLEAHEGETIPMSKLNEINRKPVGGKTRTLRGHSLTVTTKLKRRVGLAKRLREIRR
jgi:hypothetical protein